MSYWSARREYDDPAVTAPAKEGRHKKYDGDMPTGVSSSYRYSRADTVGDDENDEIVLAEPQEDGDDDDDGGGDENRQANLTVVKELYAMVVENSMRLCEQGDER